MSRLNQIEDLLKEDPNDVFLRYAYGMELQNEDRSDESLSVLEELRKEEPPYIPAFFMAAQHLAKLERYNESRDLLRDGIEKARIQGDLHAAGEMSEFLASLGEFGE